MVPFCAFPYSERQSLPNLKMVAASKYFLTVMNSTLLHIKLLYFECLQQSVINARKLNVGP